MINSLQNMAQHVPQETAPNIQNIVESSVKGIQVNSKESSLVSLTSGKHQQPVLPKQSNSTHTITKEIRALLRQQLKLQLRNETQQQMRQQISKELQSGLKQQFNRKCQIMIDQFKRLTKENDQKWYKCLQLNLAIISKQSHQPKVQRYQKGKRLPSITEQPEEYQQDNEFDNRRSSSPHRGRTPEAKKRKQRKRKDNSKSSTPQASDSLDSSDSHDSSSSRERNERFECALSKGIDFTFKQIREKYHLIPRKKA